VDKIMLAGGKYVLYWYNNREWAVWMASKGLMQHLYQMLSKWPIFLIILVKKTKKGTTDPLKLMKFCLGQRFSMGGKIIDMRKSCFYLILRFTWLLLINRTLTIQVYDQNKHERASKIISNGPQNNKKCR